jgi:RimJ/RimL family protein N-acetyltransferase
MALGGIVKGKRTTLRTPTEDDLASFNRWMADMRVRRLHRVWHEPAMPATWKERLTEQTKDKDTILWAIDADGRLVGLLRFTFGWDNRQRGWIDQLVIDPEDWRKGHASDAALAVHRYLFDYLDMQRVSTTVRADNAAARRIAEKLGYIEFGCGHDVFYRDGGYVDEVWLLMERATWDERWAAEREYAPMGGG